MKLAQLLLLVLLLTRPDAATAQLDHAGATSDATLQPGDFVRVEIWREEELSGKFLVTESGVVTLPLLGDKEVTRIPLRDLREILTREYRVHLTNPSIQVFPLRRILVLGEVSKPGPYEVDPTTTVIGLIADAEGANAAGDLKRIRIERGGKIIADRVPVDATLSSLGVVSGDQILVAPGNWFARNTSFVVSVLLALPSVIYTLTLLK